MWYELITGAYLDQCKVPVGSKRVLCCLCANWRSIVNKDLWRIWITWQEAEVAALTRSEWPIGGDTHTVGAAIFWMLGTWGSNRCKMLPQLRRCSLFLLTLAVVSRHHVYVYYINIRPISSPWAQKSLTMPSASFTTCCGSLSLLTTRPIMQI